MLVVACNSVEVSRIGDIAARAGVPVVGVIDPGVRAAVHATRNGVVGLIGTEATVRSGAYQRAVGDRARSTLHSQPAPRSSSTWSAAIRPRDDLRRPRGGILHR